MITAGIHFRLNEFDHNFFGIAEAEADVMDPQHKLLLQCTFRALEDAGVPMEGISGSRTGVYIGDHVKQLIRHSDTDTVSHKSDLHSTLKKKKKCQKKCHLTAMKTGLLV